VTALANEAPPRAAFRLSNRAAIYCARGAFLSISVWVVLTMVTHVTGPTGLHAALDLPFNFLCHRIPERTLHVFGVPMPMCSRCAGLWIGMSLTAAAAWPSFSLRALRVIFPIALGLMAIEVVSQDLGWHPVFHPTRVLSGLLVSVPFGGSLGAMITAELGPKKVAAPSA